MKVNSSIVQISSKHLQVDKANKQVFIAAGVAAFVVIFCLIASFSLFKQMMYQNKVAGAKKDTLQQLKDNQEAVSTLRRTYASFVEASPNVLGGSSVGTGAQDGDNAKIILDALPSKYDFPALATSIEKILNQQKASIGSISGTDDEVAQTASAGATAPVPIPFQVSASSGYATIRNLTAAFESSIRPIQLQTMTLNGDDGNLTLTMTANTYYQPAKVFAPGKKVVE